MKSNKLDYDFTYECHQCKTLIPGHFDTINTDVVFMVKSSEPNTWIFQCEHCFEYKT